jgi:hypothetical protein
MVHLGLLLLVARWKGSFPKVTNLFSGVELVAFASAAWSRTYRPPDFLPFGISYSGTGTGFTKETGAARCWTKAFVVLCGAYRVLAMIVALQAGEAYLVRRCRRAGLLKRRHAVPQSLRCHSTGMTLRSLGPHRHLIWRLLLLANGIGIHA